MIKFKVTVSVHEKETYTIEAEDAHSAEKFALKFFSSDFAIPRVYCSIDEVKEELWY